MIDASKPTSKHTWLAAVLAALISAPFVGLNAVASKLLFSPAAPAHFDAVSLFVARGFGYDAAHASATHVEGCRVIRHVRHYLRTGDECPVCIGR
jgi:hypothetical protein